MTTCICFPLHASCELPTCPSEPPNTPSPLSLRDFQKSAFRGCKTCNIIVSGLFLPEIKEVWYHGSEEEDDIEIELLDQKVNIQVTDSERAPYAIYWHHFGLFRQLDGLVQGNAGKQINIDEGGCKAFPITKSLSEATDSETSWRNLKAWLDDCDQNHEACRRKGFNPKRVIDVKGDNAEVPQIRLLCDVDLQGENYTTLSYTWGRIPFLNSTTSNLSQRMEAIHWNDLPKTFKHAIIITRTLEIRYLWIDALCILQDSRTDWEIESSKMSPIYQNSYLTIAATHSENTLGGCFSPTPDIGPESPLPIHPNSSVRIRTIKRDTHFDFGHFWARASPTTNPLAQRAWALQERILSPRTVHYLSTELVWECNTVSDCQCRGIHVIYDFKPAYIRALSTSDKNTRTNNWIWILQVYTNQKLTKMEDRLPALSGLARQAMEKGWEGYYAGFWRHDLELLTAWELDDPGSTERCKTYLGPSWSWVNVMGKIGYAGYIGAGIRQYLQTFVRILDVEVKTGIDPTGSVEDGYMRIAGRSLDALMLEGSKLATSLGDVYEDFVPDTLLSAPLQESVKVKLVPWVLTADNTGGHLLTLVFARAKERKDAVYSREGAYERIGILRVKEDGEEFQDVESFAWWQAAREEVLTLV